MREIQRGAAWGDEQARFAFDQGLRRNIAGVGVIPDSDKGFTNIAADLYSARFDGCDEFFAIGQDRKTFRRINAGPRAGDYRTRRDIALIGAVEDQNTLGVGVAEGDDVVNGINSDSPRAKHHRLRARNDSQRRHVAVGGPGENQNRLARGHNNFVMNIVQRQLVILLEKSSRTLNRADRRRVTARVSTVNKNRFR